MDPAHAKGLRLGVLVGIALVLIGSAAATGTGPAPARGPSLPSAPAVSPSPTSSSSGSGHWGAVQVTVNATPSALCPPNWPSCGNGPLATRVAANISLAANGPASAAPVQLLFVLETTPYDGVYDTSAYDWGRDACAVRNETSLPLCQEANGVPFFIDNAGPIAAAIAAAHPGSNVSFGLVDFFALGTGFDDGDGYSYHVDIGQFTAASGFQVAVNKTLKPDVFPVLPDSDLSDNTLTASSITALFGALSGEGVNWSANARHVVVWMGSAAPRDPHYPENYCAGASEYATTNQGAACIAATCEPAFSFATVASPNCEGWVTNQSGNATQSIAWLANNGSTCRGSLGLGCVIDTIDLAATPTNASSPGWPSPVNRTQVDANVANVIAAACDIANATGGSWDGPTTASCRGTNGTLAGDYLRAVANSSAQNPTLLAALANVSFGDVNYSFAPTSAGPMVAFALGPNTSLAAQPNFAVACNLGGGVGPSSCLPTPSIQTVQSTTVLTWNLTSTPTVALRQGGWWTIAFDLSVAPGASGTLPLFRCATADCVAAGAGPIDGVASGVLGALTAGALAPVLVAIPLPLVSVSVPAPEPIEFGLATTGLTGEAPFAVTFIPTASGGQLPWSFEYQFGDGATAIAPGPLTHTYGPGTFTVSVAVQDAANQTVGRTVVVTVAPPLAVAIAANRSTGVAPVSIALSADITGGVAPYTIDWRLPDGTTASTAALDYTFATAGPVQVWVSVTDADHVTQTANLTVTPSSSVPPHNQPNSTTPPPSGPNGPNASGHPSASSTLWWPYAAGASVIVGALGVILVLRYRRRAPPKGPPTGRAGAR